jgi:hypothetical protein
MVPDSKRLQWFERELTVVVGPPGPLGAEANWGSIVKNRVHVEASRWPDGKDPGEKAKLQALKDWNSSKWDGWLERNKIKEYGKNYENVSGIGSKTGIEVPWLQAGDKIIVRYPFQPEYPEEEKVEI